MRAVAVSCLSLLSASCGESSGSGGTPNGGAGLGSGASGGSSGASGGSSGASGGSSGGASGASGGREETGGAGAGSGTAGASGARAGSSAGGESGGGSGGEGARSGAGGESGEAGTAATGGMPVEGDGFICQSPERCDTGERCSWCSSAEGSTYLCVPNPDEDPAGYAAATEGCDPGVLEHFANCDGPEDCPSDRYCVWGHDPQAAFGGQCVSEDELPEPQRASCCFTCGALPLCILCQTETDCPGELQCVESVGAPNAVNGCRPPS